MTLFLATGQLNLMVEQTVRKRMSSLMPHQAFILNGQKFKYEGRGAIIMTLESLYMGCTNLPGGGGKIAARGFTSPQIRLYYTLVCV